MLVQKQLAHFNDAMQGKSALQQACEAPTKKGASPLPKLNLFSQLSYFRTDLFSPHAGLLGRIFGQKRK